MVNENQKIIYVNGCEKQILLIVEPWAEEYLIEPLAAVEIIGLGGKSSDAFFELESRDGMLILYAWEGCIVQINELCNKQKGYP